VSQALGIDSFRLDTLGTSAQFNDLEYYLVMPIQRLPRYQLLLQKLQQLTPSDHMDYQNITQALQLVKGVLEHINLKKKHEAMITAIEQNIKEIYVHFPEGLVAPHRLLIKEGILAVEDKFPSKKDDISSYAFLFSDMIITAVKRSIHSGYHFLACYNLDDFKVEDSQGNTFLVIMHGTEYLYLTSPSVEDKLAWQLAVKDVSEHSIRCKTKERATLSYSAPATRSSRKKTFRGKTVHRSSFAKKIGKIIS